MIRVGADPEFFVIRNGHFLSGHDFPCGDKENPRPTPNGSVQCDGLALEVNVKPSRSRNEFIRNVTSVVSDLKGIVRSHDKACRLVARPSVFFQDKHIKKLPPHILDMGCSRDYSAYSMRENPRPDAKSNMRAGGGHVHISWTKEANPQSVSHFTACCSLVKELDFYLGLPSLTWDHDKQRRLLYGKAGAFRPKPYGLEYRVLSNKWVDNPSLVGLVFDQAIKAVNRFNKGVSLFSKYGVLAQNAIDHDDIMWHKKDDRKVLYQEIMK